MNYDETSNKFFNSQNLLDDAEGWWVIYNTIDNLWENVGNSLLKVPGWSKYSVDKHTWWGGHDTGYIFKTQYYIYSFAIFYTIISLGANT